MIPSLSRHLPRTAASAAAALRSARPAMAAQPVFTQRACLSSTGDKDDTLNRDAIADIIANEYKLTKADGRRIVSTVFDTIVESVSRKETVSIGGFGKFTSVDSPAREYTNPSDPKGPKVWKPATNRARFQAYSHFKKCVAEGKSN